MEEEKIISKFLSIDDTSLTTGKYTVKDQCYFDEIKKISQNSQHKIMPIQFTFEITNRCNCMCKDCGMAANRISFGKDILSNEDLKNLSWQLIKNNVAGYAITGGEPFLEFDKMCYFIELCKTKTDVIKIISNGFWGKNAENYFQKLEKSGLFDNKYFIPSLQISIGEQDVPLEYICNIINYIATNYTLSDIHFGIIHTRQNGLQKSQLQKLYEIYLEKFGEFPNKIVYLTDSYYINSNPIATEFLTVPTYTVYDLLDKCDNTYSCEIGKFVSPKIFMKCNGDCYPCEVFNTHKNFFIGNFFNDGLHKIINNMNSNKYVKFINKYGTIGFRNVIPKDILLSNKKEIVCTACQFCIEYCEKENLIK